MITYAELRERVRTWPKYDGCRFVERAPLLTRAFPGSFNLSATEHHWLGEYGSYLDWPHDFVFSAIQTCVRPGDVEHIRRGSRWHLGVFEMADLSGELALAAAPDYGELQGWQLREFVRFMESVGIPPARIHASYCAGGPVAELTGGDYSFRCEVAPDRLSADVLREAGVPEANLIADRSRDTLLSLHVHRPTPWGYRNEIFVDVGTNGAPDLVDVATSEYLVWRPVFGDPRASRADIVDLEPLDAGALGIQIGLERLCAVVNGLGRAHEVDYLAAFYRELHAAPPDGPAGVGYAAGESLRALHRIVADLHQHAEARFRTGDDGTRRLSTKRRKKAARLKRNVVAALDVDRVRRLLEIHAHAQPWHPGLVDAIAPTVEAVERYRGGARVSRTAAAGADRAGA